MMTRLVNLANKNKILGIAIRFFVCCTMKLINFWYEISGFLRCRGLLGGQYRDIRDMKGKYEGKRCFVLCTGPSLTIEDLEKLQGEYTFGMNSICLLADRTKFRPTFYGCNDLVVYRKLESDIGRFCNGYTEVFVSDRIKRHCKIPKAWHIYSLNVAYHAYDRWFKHNYWCKFSNNCYKNLYDMHSVTHSMIQLAVYMGFKEIYLLGADCSFQKGKKNHFQDYGVTDTKIETARDRNIAGYEEVKKQMDKYGFKVYNATRGGSLEVFKRVELDELLLKGNI